MTAENCGLGFRRRCFFFFLMTIWCPSFNFTCTNDHPNFNYFKRRRLIFTFTADRGKESVFTHVGSIYANLFEKKKASQLIFYVEGFRQAKCHVVSQTQGYYLGSIWDSLVKFQGVGLF